MKISDHAAHTEELYGLRAEDIHKWIDGYFDRDSFEDFLRSGKKVGYDPYDHRKFRHCREALPEVIQEFSHKYNEADIRNVFECHIRDDYDDYIPSREDFANGTFSEKYHESEEEKEAFFSSEELSRYFKGIYYGRNHYKKKHKAVFRFRIVLPAATALILFLSSVFLIILPMFHDSLMKEKKLMIRDISSVAASIVNYYISLEEENVLSREEAQAAAVDEIRKLRYGSDHLNYFWVTDEHPVMIVHPWRPDLEGQDLSDYRDSMNKSGKKLFVQSVRLVQQEGGGFLEYLWQLEEENQKVVSKLSYVQGVEQWQWIIGTGIYVHDVEEEIQRLTSRLVIVFFVITGLMIILVLYMVMQSRVIEQNRQQAEAGLVEAKERYRALVEASNEGYLLLLSDHKIFCNPTFQRMTGYGEKDVLEQNFIKNLFPDNEADFSLKKHLSNLQGINPQSDEFETVLLCKSGSFLDVLVRVSRIFLTEENGLVLSFQPLMRDAHQLSLYYESEPLNDPEHYFSELAATERPGQIVRLLGQLPQMVRPLLGRRLESHKIRAFISDMYGAAIKRLIDLTVEEQALPDIPFAFLSLGSSGRMEMTLFSDQDNALVFDSDAQGQELENQRLGFLRFADRICKRLNTAGFPYCPGGIMAVNPAHCLSLKEWKQRYSGWFRDSGNLALLDLHVFFDIEAVWGKSSLVDDLKEHFLNKAKGKAEFFTHFARNCLQYKSALGSLGQLKSESRDGEALINIKDCLIPLVNFARLYSMKYEIPESSTLIRLNALEQAGVLNSRTHTDMTRAFETLWEFRFSNQILSHGELRKVNDDMSLKGLSPENRKKLQAALSVINAAQGRLSYDFLGMDMR